MLKASKDCWGPVLEGQQPNVSLAKAVLHRVQEQAPAAQEKQVPRDKPLRESAETSERGTKNCLPIQARAPAFPFQGGQTEEEEGQACVSFRQVCQGSHQHRSHLQGRVPAPFAPRGQRKHRDHSIGKGKAKRCGARQCCQTRIREACWVCSANHGAMELDMDRRGGRRQAQEKPTQVSSSLRSSSSL